MKLFLFFSLILIQSTNSKKRESGTEIKRSASGLLQKHTSSSHKEASDSSSSEEERLQNTNNNIFQQQDNSINGNTLENDINGIHEDDDDLMHETLKKTRERHSQFTVDALVCPPLPIKCLDSFKTAQTKSCIGRGQGEDGHYIGPYCSIFNCDNAHEIVKAACGGYSCMEYEQFEVVLKKYKTKVCNVAFTAEL